MIQIGLEFDRTTLGSLLAKILTLPAVLRPKQFRFGEDEQPIVISDFTLKSLSRRANGFFLLGPHFVYDIVVARNATLFMRGSLELAPALAQELLSLLTVEQPIFGYACAPEEQNARNRIETKLGINSLEGWVGRDPQRKLPGLYWLTLIPDRLAEKHNIPLDWIESICKEHLRFEGGQHLFRLYDQPEDWSSPESVAKLARKVPGIFDVEVVKHAISAATSISDLLSILSKWK